MSASARELRSDRLVRGSALAAMLTLAATLLALGLYFYRPAEAAAEPAARAFDDDSRQSLRLDPLVQEVRQ
jgi:hypothetical protein